MFEYNEDFDYSFTLETPLQGDDYFTVTTENEED